MLNSFSKMTAYEVSDLRRTWGKVHDFLLEFPSCQARYFSVDACVGVGVKEIWAPVESVAMVDDEKMAIVVSGDLDHDMLRHLSRLEAPVKDRDELKLQRLYQLKPEWLEKHRAQHGMGLRKQSRLLRGSELLGYSATTRQGGDGMVRELVFESQGMSLDRVELEFRARQNRVVFECRIGHGCELLPQAHSLVIDLDAA